MSSTALLAALGVALLALPAFFVLGRRTGIASENRRQAEAKATAEETAKRVIADAEREAETLRKSAVVAGKEELIKLREAFEGEVRGRRSEVEREEKRIIDRETTLDRKFDILEQRDKDFSRRASEFGRREKTVVEREQELEKLIADERQRLEQLAGMSAQDAKTELIRRLEEEALADAANKLREIRERARRDAEREAKKIVALAIQRIAAEHTAESTVSAVSLPSDEMKGRIIGREGRNIRAFELATGVDVIIDDTPEAVVLSAFDPVRRETARIALERLVEDGRIHPGRIEEVVAKAAEDVEKSMVEAAEEVLYELGIHNVHPEIVKTLGRLRFRTSYGQNQLLHAKEVALLAGNMAAEMKLDVQAAKRAGLLHDVGKGMTHEHEGTHVELGYRLCKKHNESEIVLNAIRAHHDEEPHFFAETFLVSAADAISGSRPGARREMFEGYVKRLEKLEELAMEHPGVERCFAIQAGRELRVMVEPDKVGDGEMAQISEAVARKIESELQYPGQIKVVVVRETRAIDFAR
jgi:ribonuclease Y